MKSPLAVIVIFACLASPSAAIPPPEIVLEDTLALGLIVTATRVDTTRFEEPTIFVGTYRDADGWSYVLQVATNPMRITDTIYRSRYVPHLIRTGYFDDDLETDLLVAVRSVYPDTLPYFALIALSGPSFESADTVVYDHGLQDVIVNDSTHEMWVGYIHDTTYVYAPGTPDESDVLKSLGAIVHYDSLAGVATILSSDVAGRDFHLLDVDGDGVKEFVAFWSEHWYVYPCCYSGPAPNPEWIYVGVSQYDTAGVRLRHDTLRAEGSRDAARDLPPVLSYRQPIPIGDLTGDGIPEFVFSSSGNWLSYSFERFVRAYSMATMTPLWTTESEWVGFSSPYATSLWPIDDDSLPDVLVAADYPPVLRAYKGTTGESLFVAETEYYIDPVTTGYLDNSGVWKGLLLERDTLFLIRFDPPVGVRDDPVTPEQFELFPNYPNPFNAATEIEYSLSRPGTVRLEIFNVLGRHVRTLADEPLPAGRHRVTWDGTGEAGAAVASGVYFYRLRAGDQVKTRKLVVLK